MISPAQDYHRTDYVVPDKLLAGLDAWVLGLVGWHRRRQGILKELDRHATEIDAQSDYWKGLNDHHLQERLFEFRGKFRRRRRGTESLVNEALGAIREAAERKLGLRPFHVQLMGGLALHRGYLAEMATGEGKTLTAGLAAVFAGWTGFPCHIVTANDYLVQRDAEWLRPLYHFCGLKAGFVTGDMNPTERRAGYDQDITYTTSKEIVADFLRDRLRLGPWQNPSRRLIQSLLHPQQLDRADLVMRGLHTAIIDEADCLLIDEAVTPLIISAPLKNDVLREACRQAQATATGLEAGTDYLPDLRHREIELTQAGKQKVIARSEQLSGLFRNLNRRFELVQQALVAREFYLPGKQYVVVDGKVVIVDEYTGRMMAQRTWRAGLHQAIEAKE
ncbi:MAG: prepilin peptidase, partial [Verrucomicrobia bacterium]|nr:prepilin peptidase [Verrucomicrobiota bacterium]